MQCLEPLKILQTSNHVLITMPIRRNTAHGTTTPNRTQSDCTHSLYKRICVPKDSRCSLNFLQGVSRPSLGAQYAFAFTWLATVGVHTYRGLHVVRKRQPTPTNTNQHQPTPTNANRTVVVDAHSLRPLPRVNPSERIKRCGPPFSLFERPTEQHCPRTVYPANFRRWVKGVRRGRRKRFLAEGCRGRSVRGNKTDRGDLCLPEVVIFKADRSFEGAFGLTRLLRDGDASWTG